VKLHQRIITFDFVRLAAGHIEGQRVAFGVRAVAGAFWLTKPEPA
jgi:hypothetical protein